MIIWLILITLIVTGGLLVMRWLKKPILYRGVTAEAFPKFIDGMMAQGGNGFLLFFEHEGSDRFLQFAKYIEGQNRTNLHFGFPLAPWSAIYYDQLKEKLVAEGFTCDERETGEEVVTRFLRVDYIRDGQEASRLASLAIEVLGIDKRDKFTAHYEGPLSLEEWKRYEKARKAKA